MNVEAPMEVYSIDRKLKALSMMLGAVVKRF